MGSAIATMRPWEQKDDEYAEDCRLSAMSGPLSDLSRSAENLKEVHEMVGEHVQQSQPLLDDLASNVSGARLSTTLGVQELAEAHRIKHSSQWPLTTAVGVGATAMVCGVGMWAPLAVVGAKVAANTW